MEARRDVYCPLPKRARTKLLTSTLPLSPFSIGLPLSLQGSRSLHRAPALFTGLSTALNGPVASPP